MANFRSFRRFWALTAMVVMFQLVVAQAMAASAALHKHLHDHDHDHGDEHHHECVVTLMLHGGYGGVVPDIVPVEIVPAPPQAPVLTPKANETGPSHLAGGVLAHAPPRGP